MPNCWLLTALPGLQNNQEKVFVLQHRKPCQGRRAFLSLKVGSTIKTCLDITQPFRICAMTPSQGTSATSAEICLPCLHLFSCPTSPSTHHSHICSCAPTEQLP